MLVGSAGLTAAALVLALRYTSSGRPWLRTPAHRVSFIAIGVGVILLTLAGISYGLQTDLRRQYFPSCADSLGIPIAGLMLLAIVLIPVLSLTGAIVTLAFGALPAPLTQWDGHRAGRSWAITILFGVTMLAGVAGATAGAFTSDFVGPATIVALYLFASTRAALLAPRSPQSLNDPLA